MSSYEERCKLLFDMKLKKIKAQELASHLGCSSSWVSQFFNNKIDWNKETVDKAIKYIKNKQTNE